MSETIEVRGTEFDADDLRTAIDEMLGEDGQTPGDEQFIPVDSIALKCDGWDDSDAYIYEDVGEGDTAVYEKALDNRVTLVDVADRLEQTDGPTLVGEDRTHYGFEVPLGADIKVVESASNGYYIAWHSEDDMAHDLDNEGSNLASAEGYDSYAYVSELRIEE